MYIYGWNKGGKDPVPLYHWEKGKYESDRYQWGMTEDPAKAKRFKTIDDCIDNFIKHHSEKYRYMIDEGIVIFYQAEPVQVVIV